MRYIVKSSTGITSSLFKINKVTVKLNVPASLIPSAIKVCYFI